MFIVNFIYLFVTMTVLLKGVMQGKLIAVVYTLRTHWNRSLWAEFVNKNRCISVCLVSEEVKSFDDFDN